MCENVGDADDATELLLKNGISRSIVRRAVAQLGDEGKPFAVFSLVDAITQLTQEVRFAGDRTDADANASKLLALAL